MKRFLMLVGVAVVAAVMYVAASPASQQAKAPSAKQFNLLKKQVATLSKSLKTVKAEATAAAGFIATCLVSDNSGVLPVNQFGTQPGPGFFYGTTATSFALRTALDVDPAATPGGFLQGVDPSCVTGSTTLGHAQGTGHSGSTRLQLLPERGLGR